MVNTLSAVETNTWIRATWDDFIASTENPELQKAHFYYDSGYMRIENMPIGPVHGRDNLIVASAVDLYGAFNNLQLIAFAGTSFRKVNERECQPDLAYYIGTNTQNLPQDNQPVDVDTYGPPQLTIEISATTLSDDLGRKRLLYERLGVSEYWIVDVENRRIIAFAIANQGSRQIRTSSVLPNFAVDILEETLQRSQNEDNAAITRWLMQQFQ